MPDFRFIFHEPETEGKDLSMPELGNPGVGGTAYCFAIIIKYLSEDAGNTVSVYSVQNVKLPCGNVVKADSVEDAFSKVQRDGGKTVILRNHQEDRIYEALGRYDLNYIFWMHNRLTYPEIRLFSKEEKVKRVISVCREMYDLYIDDAVIEKTDYINNPFIMPDALVQDIRKNDVAREKSIAYMGSLIPDKNFHMLAEAWSKVRVKVPDAGLDVIGTGRLYDENAKLGKYGLAEESYEQEFMKWLTDEKGEILPNVRFHGILGAEKYDVFRKCSIGVINPMATETFGLAAVEMEACGLPVVCRRKNGLCDSVMDGKTGTLFKDISEFPDKLAELLTDDAKRETFSKNAMEFALRDFQPALLVPEWKRVASEVSEGKKAAYRKPVANMDNNNKRIRSIMHGIHSVPFLKWVPSIHDLQKK